jgi:hypothetical protein
MIEEALMVFPRNRMRFTSVYPGKSEPGGWIVLDLSGADLEGLKHLYLSMEDIENLKKGGDITSDRLKQARSLLGGDADEE